MKKIHVYLLFIFSFITIASYSQTVVVCNGKYSKRYHSSADCNGLHNCKGGISNVSLSVAQNQGKTPCHICESIANPNTPQSQRINSSNNRISNAGQSVQCSATTKAGKQCSRMTKDPSGLCWQHGGN
jgi:hypothetical protein